MDEKLLRRRAIRKYHRSRRKGMKHKRTIEEIERELQMGGWHDGVYWDWTYIPEKWAPDPADRWERIAKVPPWVDPDHPLLVERRTAIRNVHKYRRQAALAAMEVERLEHVLGITGHRRMFSGYYSPLDS